MMGETSVTGDGRTLTVRVPITIRRRGGRKLVIAPDGTKVTADMVADHMEDAMVKAIGRAFRWLGMLESGRYATIREIAVAEKINESYVGRVLRLTLLAPDIVEAILGGTEPSGLQLENLMQPFPIRWTEQHATLLLTPMTRCIHGRRSGALQ